MLILNFFFITLAEGKFSLSHVGSSVFSQGWERESSHGQFWVGSNNNRGHEWRSVIPTSLLLTDLKSVKKIIRIIKLIGIWCDYSWQKWAGLRETTQNWQYSQIKVKIWLKLEYSSQ